MVVLYLTSPERGTGKTMLCAGLGKYLVSKGKKVGFLRPVITDSDTSSTEGTDSDAVFMKKIFGLEEPVEHLCPVISVRSDLVSNIRDANARVSSGKDVVIVEGPCGIGGEDVEMGDFLQRASYAMAEALCARVIAVECYSPQQPPAAFVGSYEDFGNFLLGVVLNKVPVNRLEQVRQEASARFSEAGMAVLGVLPESRALLTLTVGELAEHIQGEIVSSAEKASGLIENVMLGAKAVDPGPGYFSRKANKAVVLTAERPDMQVAALETPTRCLVVSGDTPLIPTVLYNAQSKNVPIILTRADIATIVNSLEDALDSSRFNQVEKLPKLAEIVEQHFDLPAFYKGLGLAD